MEKITIRGKMEFCEEENKEYDREFTAILEDSPAFSYGNGTCVRIVWGKMKDGTSERPILVDTRYDESIKDNETDFKKWVQSYFKTNCLEHVLTFY